MINKKKDYERLYRVYKIGFIIINIIAVIGIIILGSQSLYYQLLYKEAIKQGAENTITALQMTTACISLGNFTPEEIIEETIDMFILNKSPQLAGERLI